MRAMLLALMFFLAAVSTAAGAQQAPDDQAAIAVVTNFDAALLASMHKDVGPLNTAIDAAFNVPVMAASIVGPNWSGMTAEQHTSIAAALRGYLVARFANEFDSYDGEQFRVEPAVQTRGPDKLVRTTVTSNSDDPVQLFYRLRNYQGRWRVIDVYYDGVSQLTTQRADLAAVASDVAALIAQIKRATADIHVSDTH
jgi:phospholipid transport system substrate-binding protein